MSAIRSKTPKIIGSQEIEAWEDAIRLRDAGWDYFGPVMAPILLEVWPPRLLDSGPVLKDFVVNVIDEFNPVEKLRWEPNEWPERPTWIKSPVPGVHFVDILGIAYVIAGDLLLQNGHEMDAILMAAYREVLAMPHYEVRSRMALIALNGGELPI